MNQKVNRSLTLTVKVNHLESQAMKSTIMTCCHVDFNKNNWP